MRDMEEVLADLQYCEDHIDDQLFGEAKFFIEDLSEANKMKEARLERQKQIIAEQSTKLNDAIRKLKSENKVLSDRVRALQTELEVNNRKQADEFAEVVLGCKPIPDQTAKQDDGKVDPSLVPTELIWAVAKVRQVGTMKYHNDPDNWKKVEKERFRAAAYRHFLKYIKDPEVLDDESGLPHLWHWLTNGAFLCELENYDVE